MIVDEQYVPEIEKNWTNERVGLQYGHGLSAFY